MSYSKSEVGHALNAANLERLILTCQLLGANYNPVSRQLQIGNLMQLLTDSRNAIDQVTNYLNAHKNAVNNRQENFATLKSLGTRIIGALISGGASLATIKDAKAINAKLQGKGKNVPRPPKAKVEDANSNEETNNSNVETPNSNVETNNSNEETNNSNEETPNSNVETNNSNEETNNSNVETPNSNAETNNSNAEDTKSDGKKKRVISSVQQSYAQIVAHFAQLVNFLQQTPGYNPNETDLQVSNLLRVANTLQAENSAVTLAEIGLKNARILRDDILYNPQTGVVATALLVKEYCKSVLSTKSPLYKEVNKIRFSGKK